MSDIFDVIKKQLQDNRVVIYMKGTPDFPQCGFSSKAIKLLKKAGVADFLAVNVLEDAEIRHAIKEFSRWPTIPQVYVDGEFIGGSDILEALFESGELQKLVA
jgi:monothiol glutaredoxin